MAIRLMLTPNPQESYNPACEYSQSEIDIRSIFGTFMEFTLTYSGPLPSQQHSARRATKHEMRRHFHNQLKRQWSRVSYLDSLVKNDFAGVPFEDGSPMGRLWYKIRVGDFIFLPLVIQRSSSRVHLSCGLDIKILSPDTPSALYQQGDLDNRIKVLLDSLTVPSDKGQLPDEKQKPEETPLLCLLEDDKWITRLAITSGVLLGDLKEGQGSDYVDLTIDVSIKPTEKNRAILPI